MHDEKKGFKLSYVKNSDCPDSYSINDYMERLEKVNLIYSIFLNFSIAIFKLIYNQFKLHYNTLI